MRAKLARPPNVDAEAEEDDVEADDECPICFDSQFLRLKNATPSRAHMDMVSVLQNTRTTMCGHRFCKECIEAIFQAQVEYAK